MPRECYGLSEATKETLTDNVKKLANAWDKSTRWVQRILSEDADDPFAHFLPLYNAVAKAGLTTSHYDTELEFVRRRHQGKLSPDLVVALFRAHVHAHNETLEQWMEFSEDGQLDADEIEAIEHGLKKQRDNIDLTLQSLKMQKERLVQSGPRAA